MIWIVALAIAMIMIGIRHLAWKSYKGAELKVIDGDSIQGIFAPRGESMRLAGYDAPEWNQPGGREAAQHLRRLMKHGIKLRVIDVDRYGRRVVRGKVRSTWMGISCWRSIAVLMCEAGHGHSEGAMCSAAGMAEMRARLARRGLWANAGLLGGKAMRPKAWRDAQQARQMGMSQYMGRVSGHPVKGRRW